jgi:putrescine transport system substrate-binding protein
LKIIRQICLLAVLLVSWLPGTLNAAEEPVLNVYNWADYIGETTLADFEARTGIKVVYDVYDSNDVLQGKLLAGNSGFDVVVPSSGFLARLISAGVFQPLDHARLPNLKHMDPTLLRKLEPFDPGNRHGLPYLWGTTGIGYNREMVASALGTDTPVTSWDTVFNPENMAKLSKCGISFLDAFDEVFPAVLAYKKLPPNEQDAAVFEREVVPVLESVSPHITYFHSSKYINDLANGDICVALGWSGDVLQAARRAEEAGQPFTIDYVIPTEGTSLWFDMMAIPVDAPHPDNAHRFINFLMEPEVIAKISDRVRYANANKSATPLVDKSITSDQRIYPPDSINAKNYTLAPYPARLDRQALRMWTRIKTRR